ncbi:MAG: Smr/MutS family protein, partial [Desulfovibrio sp.]|nr:Smr/MutS family protein [Desulfovibrio sp.]
GSGTDPAQGSALAQALLDELIKKGTYVLAATHFPALKSYALTRDQARAASMLFSPETRKPLFALAYDQVGASQALDVAREHGLPEAIIAGAERYLLQDGQDATSLLHKLNDLAAARAEEIKTLKAEQKKAQASALRWKERLEQDRLKLYGEVRAKAQELMQAWKEERATHKQALREMSALRASLAREGMAEDGGPASVLPAPRAIQAGDTVLHTVFRKKGTVTEVDEKRRRVRLDLGGVVLWADMKDVRESGAGKAGGRPAAQASQPKVFGRIAAPAAAASDAEAQEDSADGSDARGQSARHSAGAAFKIDVRGMRADQAIASVQACLDKAYLAELGDVEVIHGRGTGALRRAIHEWLGTCSQVASFATAPADRGGDGMTIVTLK